jgi:hypothetical protein
MNDRFVPNTTSAKVFVLLFCVAEPAMDVATGLWGLVAPVAFAKATFPSLVQEATLAASAEMMGMTRLAALMILVLGPLERIALLHGSRTLRVLFLAAMLFGDVLHLGATALYESSAGGWSTTGVSAMGLATALGATRIFYLVSGKVPVHPRYDTVGSVR